MLTINRVSPFELVQYLPGFLALSVSVLVALPARTVLPPAARPRSWRVAVGLSVAAVVLALLAGLWYFGIDGKLATYAMLALVVASMQWLAGRSWRN